MVPLLFLVLVLGGTSKAGQTEEVSFLMETLKRNNPVSTPSLLPAPSLRNWGNRDEGMEDSSRSVLENQHRRIPRGSKDWRLKHKEHQVLHHQRTPRPFDPEGYFTTPRVFNGSLLLHNPLFPLGNGSSAAYCVLLLALALFSMGVVAGLAVMCIIWNNFFLKNTWNCILASLAFWDFLVLFFCLPVVIFNELTKRRLMGVLSCKIVPYLEVTSLGVFTFSLCALSIDRFHRLTGATSRSQQQVEWCGSIVAKLSVVWFGSLLLAAPELLLWQMDTEISSVSSLPLDSCVRRPSTSLPEGIFSLVLTYQEARMWWMFGCFFCLPLLFSSGCRLLTNHMVEESARTRPSSSSSSSSSSLSLKKNKKKRGQEDPLSRTLIMLMAVYGLCCLPEHAWTIGLASASVQLSKTTAALLALIGQFLMFTQAAATPMLILVASRPLGRSFMDCCCCCCEECFPDRASSSSSSCTSSTAVSSSPSSPVSVNEDKLEIVSGTTPASGFLKKVKEAELAIGTPC
ncbi:G-protein coupled receptor 37-like 1 [Hoplias malabaricus]|uniref:G-protein coupled receptor 37-like 1 n=1 Tax=Hoplias malabaricus TaxID=27720 RepID=UPI0034629AC0